MEQLEEVLHDVSLDMTLFYRQLAGQSTSTTFQDFANVSYVNEHAEHHVVQFEQWLQRYQKRLRDEGQTSDSSPQRAAQMNAVNPLYVLRNYLAHEAIEQATQGDFSGVQALQRVLANPYEQQDGAEHFAHKRPEWANGLPGCSMLSCSS